MKARHKLLMALGVMTTLFFSVPIMAAEVKSSVQAIESTQTYQTGEEQLDDTENNEEQVQYTWVLNTDESSEKYGQWFLTDAVTNEVIDKDGAYKVNGNVYVLKQGYAQTGLVTIESVTDLASGAAMEGWKSGQYYLEEKEEPTAENPIELLKDVWYITEDYYIYYFDENGCRDNSMVDMALEVEGNVFYINAKGQLEFGLKEIEGTYYYFSEDGTCEDLSDASGWKVLEDNWYYFSNGELKTGWVQSKGLWYYMDPETGVMQTGWLLLDETYYYLKPGNGDMATGWVKVNGLWYYMDASGKMQTGWVKVSGKWYYLEKKGHMITGWFKDEDGKWYYLNPDGSMVKNTWVGSYYLGSNGAMVTSAWIGNRWVNANGLYIPGYDPDITNGKWIKDGGYWYYQREDGTYLTNMWKKINGKWYYFLKDSKMVTGWKYIGKYKYYFDSNGGLVQDLDGVIGRQSSYKITVNRAKCQVMVYASDGSGYNIPVKTFACSVGLSSTPTPTGTFSTSQKLRWHTLMGPSYGQYCTRIVGGILFHSVAGYNMTPHNLSAAEYNKLGSPASHGCVRLCVRDAKWIYDYCVIGTTVVISDTADTPFDKPATIKIPASQNWDPTDPNL